MEIGLLQDLRGFTVQIRTLDNKNVVGTGIIVSTDGKILTCAHVIQSATKSNVEDLEGLKIKVKYYDTYQGITTCADAVVLKKIPSPYTDDIVLLKFEDDALLFPSDKVAVLGDARLSEGNSFRSWGYSPLDQIEVKRISGTILGPVPPPEIEKRMVEPIQIKCEDLDNGLSGAPILDESRNLVVGIISSYWRSENKNIKSIGWAINSSIVALPPLSEYGIPLRTLALPKQSYEVSKISRDEVAFRVVKNPGSSFTGIPNTIMEWAGRRDLLEQIHWNYLNNQKTIVGLIGFGGEGKSSLARKYLDQIQENKERPNGFFWWSFYLKPDFSDFLEAALSFITGGKVDPREFSSTNLKAQALAAMVKCNKYFFVLDGFEILLEQDSDRFGKFRNRDVKLFLELFAVPDHESFCLITSRYPLIDLEMYSSYTHLPVNRLTIEEGCILLKNLKVMGTKEQLTKIVEDWFGHALTISLIGGFLREFSNSRAESYIKEKFGQIPDDKMTNRILLGITHVLDTYTRYLSENENKILLTLSAVRTPIHVSNLDLFLHVSISTSSDEDNIINIVQRLSDRKLINISNHGLISMHPLVRNYYFRGLDKSDSEFSKDVYESILFYYMAIARFDNRYLIDLPDLQPHIERAHHFCHLRRYEEAFEILQQFIFHNDHTIISKLGAYDIAFNLLLEFFPSGNLDGDPLVKEANDKSWILNEVGLCLDALGKPYDAVKIYKRSLEVITWKNDPLAIVIYYLNLAAAYRDLGQFEDAMEAVVQASRIQPLIPDERYRMIEKKNEAALKGQIEFLKGNISYAGELFEEASSMEFRITQSKYLYDGSGIEHAKYLIEIGNFDLAEEITKENLKVCLRNHWKRDTSRCLIIMGEINSKKGEQVIAQQNFELALQLAREVKDISVLIEVLLYRGRWYSKVMSFVEPALSDLYEARDYASKGNFEVLLVDIYISLAWAKLRSEDIEDALSFSRHASNLSIQLDYYWGEQGILEVTNAITNFVDQRNANLLSILQKGLFIEDPIGKIDLSIFYWMSDFGLWLSNRIIMYVFNKKGMVNNFSEAINWLVSQLKLEGYGSGIKSNFSEDNILSALISILVKFLDRNEKRLFFDLCIFPPNTKIPFSILSRYFNEKEKVIYELMNKLNELGVIELVTNDAILLSMNVREWLSNQQLDLDMKNQKFLDVFGRSLWNAIKTSDENYFWEHYVFHLLEARQLEVAVGLLKDLSYIIYKTYLCGVDQVILDFVSVIKFASGDQILEDLYRYYRNYSHLLTLCVSTSEIECNLVNRLKFVESLSPIVENFHRKQSCLEIMCKMPDLPHSNLLFTLTEHKSDVFACAINPECTKIVTGSRDKTMIVWDMSMGLRELVYTNHDSTVIDCVFYPDNFRVASVGGTSLKVWNSRTGQDYFAVECNGHITACDIAPNGSFLVTATEQGAIELWDAFTGIKINSFSGFGLITDVCVGAEGESLIVALDSGIIYFIDTFSGRVVNTSYKHFGTTITQCELSDDQKYLVIVSGGAEGDQTVRVLYIDSDDQLTFEGFQDPTGCTSIPNSSNFYIVSSGMLFKINTISRKAIGTYTGHQSAIWRCKSSLDGKYIITCSGDHTVKVWQADGITDSPNMPHPSIIDCVYDENKKKLFAIEGQSGILSIWDPLLGEKEGEITENKNFVSVVFSNDGKWLVAPYGELINFVRTGHGQAGLLVSNLRNKGETKLISINEGLPRDCAISSNSEYAAILVSQFPQSENCHHVLSGNNFLILYNLFTEQVKKIPILHEGFKLKSCCFSNDGKFIALGMGSNVLFYNSETLEENNLIIYEDEIEDLKFIPDSSLIIACLNNGSIEIRNHLRDDLAVKIKTNGRSAHKCSISRDGKFLAAISGPNFSELRSINAISCAQIWDLKTTKQLACFYSDSLLRSCVWGSDSQNLYLGGNGGIYIFNFNEVVSSDE